MNTPRDAAATRERIVAAARRSFALNGYHRATVREIASDAGVAPNLITRYFGGKQALFAAATNLQLDIDLTLHGPAEQLGRRIAQHVVRRWEGRPGDDPLLALMRAAMSDPRSAADMADFFKGQASIPLAKRLGTSDAIERATAVGSFIMGSVVQRYVFGIGAVVEAEASAFEEWLGHCLQLLLSGPALPSLAS